VDTGSEISLIPLDIAAGLPLHPTERVLLAANATEIRVAGELTIPVKMRGGCHLETTFLVSDQVRETMLGMDWLRQNRCRISFGTGALFVGRRRFPFVKRNGGAWCRRVSVAEVATLSSRIQCDVLNTMPGRTDGTTSSAWMAEVCKVQPGVHLARMVIDDNADHSRMRAMNLGTETATTDQVVGDLHPLEMELCRTEEQERIAQDDRSPAGELLAGVASEEPVTAKNQKGTKVTVHRINAGNAKPVRLSLWRRRTLYEEKIGVHKMGLPMADMADDIPCELEGCTRSLLIGHKSSFSNIDQDPRRNKIDAGETCPVMRTLRMPPPPEQRVIDAHSIQALGSGMMESAVGALASNAVVRKVEDWSLWSGGKHHKLTACLDHHCRLVVSKGDVDKVACSEVIVPFDPGGMPELRGRSVGTIRKTCTVHMDKLGLCHQDDPEEVEAAPENTVEQNSSPPPAQETSRKRRKNASGVPDGDAEEGPRRPQRIVRRPARYQD